MKIKTADLIGPALDWAVAKCEGTPLIYAGRKWPTDGAVTVEYAPWRVCEVVDGSGPYVASLCRAQYSPSTDWLQGGPIIERDGISVETWNEDIPGIEWAASREITVNQCGDSDRLSSFGPTPLIAAMRCFVASKLGDEVEIPEELS